MEYLNLTLNSKAANSLHLSNFPDNLCPFFQEPWQEPLGHLYVILSRLILSPTVFQNKAAFMPDRAGKFNINKRMLKLAYFIATY